jgi:hypothetical protein
LAFTFASTPTPLPSRFSSAACFADCGLFLTENVFQLGEVIVTRAGTSVKRQLGGERSIGVQLSNGIGISFGEDRLTDKSCVE